jgi:hypothetical protein
MGWDTRMQEIHVRRGSLWPRRPRGWAASSREARSEPAPNETEAAVARLNPASLHARHQVAIEKRKSIIVAASFSALKVALLSVLVKAVVQLNCTATSSANEKRPRVRLIHADSNLPVVRGMEIVSGFPFLLSCMKQVANVSSFDFQHLLSVDSFLVPLLGPVLLGGVAFYQVAGC